ncbi:integral membrane sensor signal transduction histidine kinase [Ruminiclostridium papyrosolvens DSM 2782]|uniref:histidine kinase n=1 Tax=Ruminiclostridium papyrosolvens DSM 2782 TaxID=588581 RepID=F1TI37_9FIRM|nr:HAMP domain-containing sensor histidine kinase [Ruminiclostridium papyrosolvens]EGD45972.1 integral membrane sensor signal transduction histidine kinase [Ruminiclostridium papyrosolvens DSM 2782]WES33639.1 HAMP domain-containing sensor histidine kinase [Ruminiclostridium papyrosolvens DSM 2782]
MKFSTKLLLNFLFLSVLSFTIIIISVNKAIDYYSFVTIEKQMMEKADMCELSFVEILTSHDKAVSSPQQSDITKSALEALKASGKEVRIYDNKQKLLGLAVDGIIIKDAKPLIFKENIKNALQGNYSYTVTDKNLIYFSIPIQDKYYRNVYVFELVENISYFYDILNKIRYILLIGAAGFIILVTLSSLYISSKTTKPIKYLLGATEKFSKQQFENVHLNRKDELGMLAEGLNHMGIQLKDYIQYQKQFVSNVSHELKTPLAAIRGFSQYLFEGENENEELKKVYYHLVNESDRLTNLINELLLLSKFDKAVQELNTERTELSELTEIVAQEFKPKAEKKDITLVTNLNKGVIASVNKTLMSHAIANVIENAIKYSNPKSRIIVETFTKDDNSIVKISDEGIGIAKSEIEMVQERFYRAQNSPVASGSGLGLSICKEIIQKFNGQLVIESEIDIGTAVSLIMPST